MSQQIQISGGAKVRNLQDVIIGTSGVLSSLAFDVANGVPKLDSNGKILVSQLPNSVMEYKGTWNAATNTPTLVNGTGNQGDVYLCNVAGTVDFGAGPIAFVVGDQVIYSGSIWQRASGATGTVTSVAITESGDSLNITGSPITTSGTINIGFNGTNLQYVNGAGNLTTFPTLITSIGLSMPSAFSVANSPLTANGTIAVTGAGIASQYIRGDGTLATFPSNAGGGSSVNYYLNGSVNASVAGYKQMDNNAIIGGGTDFTLTGNGLIAQFLTDVGNPNRVQIPSGAWNFEMYFNSSSNGGAEGFYVELFKYDGSTFTLIATSSATPESITGGTTVDLYLTSLAVPTTALLTTDRLAVRVYIVNNGGGRTITLHTENNTLCEIITTFAGGIASLNGLTANTQYLATGTSGTDFNIVSSVDTHTFNLPVASATNTGKLSSTDWTTFNNKQNALTNPVTGTGTTNTLPKFTAASTIGNSNITDTGSLITLGSNSYVNGALGIGSTSLTGFNLRISKSLTGSVSTTGIQSGGVIQSDVTSDAQYFSSSASTAAASFTVTDLAHFIANQGTFGAGSTVTKQYGFRVAGGLTGATNNYAFFSDIPAAANRWNLYMNGTANNYLAGSLGIGTTSLTGITLNIAKNLTGSVNSNGISQSGVIQSDVTGSARYNDTYAQIQNTAFTLGNLFHYRAGSATFTGATVTNQYGFYVDSTAIGATNNYAFFGGILSGTNRWNLYMSGTANNYMAGSLGIGSTSLTGINLRIQKDITGGTAAYGVIQGGTVLSDVTSQAWGFNNSLTTQASAFTLTHYYHYASSQSTIGATSAVTNQYGFYVFNSLTGATNNYGFYGNIAAGTNRWNLYMNGTANNYMAGSLGIGSTSLTARLDVRSSATAGSTASPTFRAYAQDADSYFEINNNSSNSADIKLTRSDATTMFTINGHSGLGYLFGQLGVGVASPNASAKVQIDSTTQGFLPPRMTSAQRAAIATPATGLIVYQTDSVEGLYVYSGGSWKSLTMV